MFAIIGNLPLGLPIFCPSADRAGELPKLVEDLFQTSISTGPRGAFRMAQGIQAVLGVGGEWLNDFSKVLSRVILVILFL
jgi:aarF domain-containing kinase